MDLLESNFNNNPDNQENLITLDNGKKFLVHLRQGNPFVFQMEEKHPELIQIMDSDSKQLITDTASLAEDQKINIILSDSQNFNPGRQAYLLGFNKLITNEELEKEVLSKFRGRYIGSENLILDGEYIVHYKVKSTKSVIIGALLGVVVGGACLAFLFTAQPAAIIATVVICVTALVGCFTGVAHYRNATKNQIKQIESSVGCGTSKRQLGCSTSDYTLLKYVKAQENDPKSKLHLWLKKHSHSNGAVKSKSYAFFTHIDGVILCAKQRSKESKLQHIPKIFDVDHIDSDNKKNPLSEEMPRWRI